MKNLTQEELSLLQAEYEYELETLEEILYVLKEVISSRSPVGLRSCCFFSTLL